MNKQASETFLVEVAMYNFGADFRNGTAGFNKLKYPVSVVSV